MQQSPNPRIMGDLNFALGCVKFGLYVGACGNGLNIFLYNRYCIVLLSVFKMGKFAIADEQLARIVVCRKCKTRNKIGRETCRKCGSVYLRPKSREIKVKK